MQHYLFVKCFLLQIVTQFFSIIGYKSIDLGVLFPVVWPLLLHECPYVPSTDCPQCPSPLFLTFSPANQFIQQNLVSNSKTNMEVVTIMKSVSL